ncbi:uncharacterized protein PHALS_14580 [Plasmopara halstedii]|uniref:Uncharacterized protein n=1 Tax=Plasmopara halstedii TaxID=4781 RepID=A0A0P1ATS3_PLAHL|nr:uncharacterized protein PHALS_14580 [Plasmopara halstedii]CEG44928.1 hypothetical protein PHALS_14580 [Plasmopara halstedii]|eukprot:XP_024581297.1 hypothetical protein PHALS_14580 [Plasmopara halstedii]
MSMSAFSTCQKKSFQIFLFPDSGTTSMKLFPPFLSALALVEGVYQIPDDFPTCPVIGGPHGKKFNDAIKL